MVTPLGVQLPRNIFRKTANAFKYDKIALVAALECLVLSIRASPIRSSHFAQSIHVRLQKRGSNKMFLPAAQKLFVTMPFQHRRVDSSST
jgi:uncharacterized protein (DUF924 family)